MRHPVFYTLVRFRVGQQLRRQGVAPRAVADVIDACDESAVDAAAADAGVDVARGLGDGRILDAILEFLRSEQGQRLVQALVAMLLALLAA